MKNEAKGKISRQMEEESISRYKIGVIISMAILCVIIIAFIIRNQGQNEKIVGMQDSLDSGISNEKEIASMDIEEASSSIGKTVNEVKDEAKNITISLDDDENTNSSKVNEIKEKSQDKENIVSKINQEDTDETDEKETEEDSKEIEPTFSMPVEGEIIKEYAKDKLIYSDTLKEWITHAGIDIKADKTTIVKSSESGKIKSIKNDPRYGLTVVIEHNNGYSSVYSNLLTAEFVTIGENVEKGQTIGTIGNTATFEMADESHLHFEILKDNVQIDPNMYIK